MAPEPSPAVRCRGLCKHFHAAASFSQLLRFQLRGRRIDALRDVELDVRSGAIVGVLGENGAGKSTLLRLIAGLLLPDSGSVEVLGADVATEGHQHRARVGYVIADERSFAWRLTARDNLRFFAALYGLSGDEATERIDAALEEVDLREHARRAVSGYSTGMRQRLALARGLLGAPEIFLFDEPTRGIDPVQARRLRQFLRDRLLSGRTAIVATHDVEEARFLCDEVVVVRAGQVVARGPAEATHELLGLKDGHP
ncbi:MAG: ABC transporter ATP-binding protein [Deltaproteobacteria bacterium]|nr:ABC transporter ATP-binding protein [Deltaproteobacteria bacterium]